MINSPKDPQRIMTVREVSQFLKIPASTIYDLVKKGKIKGVKFGKHWRFLEKDILDYLHGVDAPKRSSERRKSQRLNTEISCQLLDELKRRGFAKARGTVLNVCEDGAFFVHDDPSAEFEVGDPIQICLKLPGLRKTGSWIQGRIVRKQSKNRLGIKFRNMTDQDREVIRDYVG